MKVITHLKDVHVKERFSFKISCQKAEQGLWVQIGWNVDLTQ